MIFSRKNKDKDIDEIKKAMDDAIEDDSFDKDIRGDIPEIFTEEMPSPRRGPEHREGMVAPLFVKVEKYHELLTTVHGIKMFVSSIKEIFNILQELEAVRSEALKVMRASVQRLERSIMEIDTELLRPRGVDFTELVESETEVKHIEDSLTDLQKQIADLRRELKDLE